MDLDFDFSSKKQANFLTKSLFLFSDKSRWVIRFLWIKFPNTPTRLSKPRKQKTSFAQTLSGKNLKVYHSPKTSLFENNKNQQAVPPLTQPTSASINSLHRTQRVTKNNQAYQLQQGFATVAPANFWLSLLLWRLVPLRTVADD